MNDEKGSGKGRDAERVGPVPTTAGSEVGWEEGLMSPEDDGTLRGRKDSRTLNRRWERGLQRGVRSH